MSRVAAVFLLMAVLLSAGTQNFGFTKRVVLKKDQIAEIVIQKDYPKSYAKEGLLQFRWTLFHNKRLVLLLDYEGYKYQYILEPFYGRRSVRVDLTGDYKRIDRRPFMLLTFERFDSRKRLAHFLVEVSDPAKRLEIKTKKPARQR